MKETALASPPPPPRGRSLPLHLLRVRRAILCVVNSVGTHSKCVGDLSVQMDFYGTRRPGLPVRLEQSPCQPAGPVSGSWVWPKDNICTECTASAHEMTMTTADLWRTGAQPLTK